MNLNDLTRTAQLKVVVQYMKLVAFTILDYDYFLTLPDEVRLFWGTQRKSLKRTGAIFLLNRYIQLVGNTVILLQDFATISSEGCKVLLVFHQWFVIVTQTTVGFVLIMRTYAIYEKNFWVLLVLLCLVVVLVGIAVGFKWAVVTPLHGPDSSTIVLPGVTLLEGCTTSLPAEQSQRLAIVWEGLLFADTVVLGLTAYRTFRLRKSAARDMLRALLRDGFAYYLAISAANSLNIVTLLSSQPIIRGAGTSFANVVSAISISRLILSLRNRAYRYASTPSPQNGEDITADIFFTVDESTSQNPTSLDMELGERLS